MDSSTDNKRGDSRLGVAAECLWLLIIFIIPLYFNPLYSDSFLFAKAQLFQFVVLVLLGITAARWLLTGRDAGAGRLVETVKRSPLQVAAIVFGFAWIISTIFSLMPYRSLWGSLAWQYGLSSILCQVIFFIIIAQSVTTRAQVYRIIYTLIISSGVACIIGITQLVFPDLMPWGMLKGRVLSTIGNPLGLSAFIAMTIPLTLAMIIIRWKGAAMKNADKIVFFGLITVFGLQFVCLTMAQYSITILVFVIGIFIFFGLLGLYLKRKSTLTLSILSVLAIVLTATILIGQLLLPSNGLPPDGRQSAQESAAEQVGLSTLGTRVNIWKSAADVIIDPAVTKIDEGNLTLFRRVIGFGPETFIVVSQAVFPADVKSYYTSISLLLAQPENHYLYLLATVGFFGALSFLCLLGIFFYLGFRLLSSANRLDAVILTAAIVAAVIQYCAYIVFNPSVLVPEMVFWLMMGLAVAMVRLKETQQLPGPVSSPELSHNAGSSRRHVGKMREAAAAMLVLLCVLIGAALFVPASLANIKIKESTYQDDTDRYKAMTMITDAIALQPDEAYYYGLLGYYAYSRALTTEDPVEKAKLLAVSTAAYGSSTRLEPLLAYWHYALADNYLYWANQGAADRLPDALKSYAAADALFPENSFILNKWALALMNKGDYEEAGRRLTQSDIADNRWTQTTYYRGLLEVYQRCYCTAGNCFVYPVRDNPVKLGSFMGFCKQLSLYGGINKVVEGLKVYVACHRDDWLGFTLLGIADVYGNNIKDGKTAFIDAAGRITVQDAALLNEIVSVMAREKNDFQASTSEIQAMLAPMIDK